MSEYVTINAVAEKFNVSISTIRQWIRKDNIPRNTYILSLIHISEPTRPY